MNRRHRLRVPKEGRLDIHDLEALGYVSLKYPAPLRKRVKEAVESWQRFCNLPDEEKLLLAGEDRVKDFGYARRRDEGRTADNKELFHVCRYQMKELTMKAADIKDSQATEFITAVDALITEVEPVVVDFAGVVAKSYGLHGFEEAVRASSEHWTFRYLHYLTEEEETLSHAHADKGGFTFHLYETHGGGEYLGFDKKWLPWPVSEDKTIIFPSMNLQHRSKGRLKALWHRVMALEEVGAARGRFSMVAFIDFFHSHHRRDDSSFCMFKELEPGFNYDMPFPEFEKFFVPNK